MAVTLSEISDLLHRIVVRVPGAKLREEDRRKAAELLGILTELDRILPADNGVLVDAACGRAYVGIAAAVLLRPGLQVIGIEAEPRRAALARTAADALGVRADIRCEPLTAARLVSAPTVLVALHACGPALDAALTLAISAEARHILAVPCCHQKNPEMDKLFLHRGVLRARLDRDMQDHRRALRLEAAGWVTESVEVFPARVSPQNLLLRARRDPNTNRQERARLLLAAGQ